jgi:hypothetical protein
VDEFTLFLRLERSKGKIQCMDAIIKGADGDSFTANDLQKMTHL